MTQPLDWQIALQEWLENNPRQMPDELAALRQEFLRRFPRDHVGSLTLEEYALGHDRSRDSFCYWLEYETKQLGNVGGGSAAKWGIWWSRPKNEWSYNKGFNTNNPQEVLEIILDGLIQLLTAAENEQFEQLDEIGDWKLGRNRNSLRAKPLYLYFPDKFLPIANPVHLANILGYFGQKPVKGLHGRNRQLLAYLQSLPAFDGFDTLQMMRFLYAYKLHQPVVIFQNPAVLDQTISYFVRFANTPEYERKEYGYKKELLTALRKILDSISEGNPVEVVDELKTWLSDFQAKIDNLTSWQNRDVFSRYLTAVPSERIQQQLQTLLDEDGALQERIDGFRDGFEADYQKYVGAKESLNLGFISLFLMGTNSETHIIYRASIISKACVDWGIHDFTSGARNDGEKYAQLYALAPILQARLAKALGRQVDMIDVHSLLWFNYTDAYDKYKQSGQTEALEERPFMRDLLRITQRTKNVILYGPPGTGKTYWVQQYSKRFTGQRTRFVTFHQSFAYEEFVEGLKPSSDAGQIQYHVKSGVFRQICKDAEKDPDNEYLLVIDEINRANIAKVFGELITLIEDDKRLGADNQIQVTLPYSGDLFGVPANLTILGTMNTADRSIALLDIALRRRFTFIAVTPNTALLPTDIQGISLQQLLRRLNERIALMLDQDHKIGHSYFMDVNNLADLRFVWKHRILPLLQEYFYNDGERLQQLLGNKFITLHTSDGETSESLSDHFDIGRNHYQLKELSDEVFIASLQKLAGQSTD